MGVLLCLADSTSYSIQIETRGLPVLSATLARLERTADATFLGGVHSIVVGNMEQCSEGLHDAPSLLHDKREYGTVCRMRRHEAKPWRRRVARHAVSRPEWGERTYDTV